MSLLAGQITLGIYAALLGVGGVIGFVKAGSRPSLIAGLVSAAVAVVCLVLWRSGNRLGLYLGVVLAIALFAQFGARFRKTHKFMPSGLLAVVSVAVAVTLGLLAAGVAG
jgi:uncharacterized membrane protein (UPF0136 family)